MNTHEMNLQPKYFNFIKNGTKRIEIRLNDEKRQLIQLGDIIKFTNSEGDQIETEVIGLLHYKTFSDLFQDFDEAILADTSITKPELLTSLGDSSH